MPDTDSTAGEPAEPVELPTHQAETPEQQKEFDLGFEYGMELLRLENKLDLLNADIHSLKYPLGNPEKNLERVAQRKELEDKAAEVQHRIGFIRQWFATKPANLDGIPTDTDTLPADTSTAALDTASTLSTEPGLGKIRALKPPVIDSEIDSFLRDVYHTCAKTCDREPTAVRMISFVHTHRDLFKSVSATENRPKSRSIILQSGTCIIQETIEDWKKNTVMKEG